ncbi:MAG TPA: DNA polymerase [Nitrososphaera sp.]
MVYLVTLKVVPYVPLAGERFGDRKQNYEEKRSVLGLPLVALDSEGQDGANNYHFLTNVQALWAKGKAIIEAANIRTDQVLNFLVRLPPKHVYVIFAGNYDFNMWLRDIRGNEMVELLANGETTWRGYFIKWIPNKILTIKRGQYLRVIYDVFAWYQQSFVKACANWHVGTPEQLELITTMKELRGNFSEVSPERIKAYCWLELELLLSLVEKLRQKILQTEYRPNGLYGPGAFAAAILKHHKVKEHYGDYPTDQSLHAYYGGRFDSALFGWFTDVYEHDIHSAYPDQIRYLPCTRRAEWQASTDPAYSRYGLYHIKWKVNDDTAYPPFPWRTSSGKIYYPTNGEGWYHADEVRAAREIFGKRAIRVVDGIALIERDCDLGCNGTPYKFVENLYEWRLRLEAEGNHEQAKVVKLAINSLYGKTAQSVGSKKSAPPFQNFFLAGAITAGTRAKLLRAIGLGENVISIATDGLYATERLNVPESENLGDWEVVLNQEHIQLGNGIAKSKKLKNGQLIETEKSRGFNTRLLDYDKVRAHIEAHGPWGYFEYPDKRQFITLREAYARNKPEIACHWVPGKDEDEATRLINLSPERRDQYDVNLAGVSGPTYYGQILQWRRLAVRVDALSDTTMSSPFKPKQSWDEVQALREIYFPDMVNEP